MAQNGPSKDASTASLIRALQTFPALFNAEKLLIAYSGGLDSTVLLHLLRSLQQQGQIRARLEAIHIHHGLQAEAEHWLEHCRSMAENLNIAFTACRVKVASGGGESPEAAARQARYQAFEEALDDKALLVQGHHLDDQLETVLLHLFRGSGPRGIAGIPAMRDFAAGKIVRPLLQCTRGLLLDYALLHQLQWIEDDSNTDQRYDRNFLRHSIIPSLKGRWPDVAGKLGLSASLCAEAANFSDRVASQDLQLLATEQANVLSLFALLQLDEARKRNVLRYWVASLTEALSGSPITHQALQSVLTDLLPAAEDAQPCIAWGAGDRRLELRRYQDGLYLIRPVPVLTDQVLLWNVASQLQLPASLGSLALMPEASGGLQLEVRFRTGGEKIKMAGRPTRPLKKLLQEIGVPPWLRDAVPLVYHKGELLAVANLAYAESWAQNCFTQKAKIHWFRSHLHCGY